MGGFYGYDPGNYVPNSSHWERMFGQAAQTILQIPQVLEAEKSLQEGRTSNNDIYEGLKTEISGMKDEDVKTYFGYDKNTLLKMTKPGRNEGLEYFPRFAKITGDGLKSVYAMKNLNEAQGRINAIGKNMDVADEVRGVMVDQTFKGNGMDVQGDIANTSYQEKQPDGTMKTVYGQSAPTGESSPVMKPIANYASPEQVQGIASKYNVPLEKLQPEMSQANNRRDAFQLRQIDPTGTQLTEMQRIGGGGDGIAPLTMSAIGTMPNQNQEAANMVAAKNAVSSGVKAEADMKEAEAKLAGEVNKKNKEDATTRQQEINNYTKLKEVAVEARAKAQSRYDALSKVYATTRDEERDSIAKEMKKLASEVERYNREEEQNNGKINKLTNLKLKDEGVSNAAINDAEEFSKKYYAPGLAPGATTNSEVAMNLMNYIGNIEKSTGTQIGVNIYGLKQALDEKEPIAKIMYKIRKRAGLDE